MVNEFPLPTDPDASPGYHFPGWMPKAAKERMLAYFHSDSIFSWALTDEEDMLHDVGTAYALMEAAFTWDLLIFVENILALPYLDELLTEYKAVIYATPKGIPTAVQLHGKKNKHHATRWLIQASTWTQKTPDSALLVRLRRLFEHCGVGVANTPGGLGLLLQKWCYKDQFGEDWYAHRQPLPPLRCVEDLQRENTGARSEQLADPQEVFDLVYELDIKNAYGAAFARVPGGLTIPHMGTFVEQYATFVARCVVTLCEPLTLGIFPVREGEGNQVHISYPTRPGQYEAFLWKEEIDLIREKGGQVLVGPGWGWLSMSEDNARWVRLMTELRDSAPDDIVDWVKLAIVASIGRHGCPWQSFILVDEENRVEGDLEASFAGLCYDWYVHKAMLHIPESMQHWFSYTLMQCRLLLYKEALPYALRGQLLATNVDGLYVSSKADVSEICEKHEQKGKPAGTLRKQQLSQVQFPALRHLKSMEKTRLPGIPKSER